MGRFYVAGSQLGGRSRAVIEFYLDRTAPGRMMAFRGRDLAQAMHRYPPAGDQGMRLRLVRFCSQRQVLAADGQPDHAAELPARSAARRRGAGSFPASRDWMRLAGAERLSIRLSGVSVEGGVNELAPEHQRLQARLERQAPSRIRAVRGGPRPGGSPCAGGLCAHARRAARPEPE